MKKAMLGLAFAFLAALTTNAEDCSDILKQGIHDEFHYKSSKDFYKAMKELFKYDFDSLSKTYAEDKNSLGISIPIADAIFNLGVRSNSTRETYNSFKLAWDSENSGEVKEKIAVEFSSRIVSSKVVDAWLLCMKQKSTDSLEINISGDEFGEMTIRVDYRPKAGSDPKKILVSDIAISNLDFVERRIQPGSELLKNGGLVQKFKRLDPNTPASIVFGFSNFGTRARDFAAKPAPPPPPPPPPALPPPPQPRQETENGKDRIGKNDHSERFTNGYLGTDYKGQIFPFCFNASPDATHDRTFHRTIKFSSKFNAPPHVAVKVVASEPWGPHGSDMRVEAIEVTAEQFVLVYRSKNDAKHNWVTSEWSATGMKGP